MNARSNKANEIIRKHLDTLFSWFTQPQNGDQEIMLFTSFWNMSIDRSKLLLTKN